MERFAPLTPNQFTGRGDTSQGLREVENPHRLGGLIIHELLNPLCAIVDGDDLSGSG